uniref:sestrin-1-like n=1 Tax=Pristiophorus japonicus TaxID=55135 RepID=UPI00398E4F05
MSVERGQGCCDSRKWSDLMRSREPRSRAEAMESAAGAVHSCLDRRCPAAGEQHGRQDLQEPPTELHRLLLLLLRLSHSCPFQDLRHQSAALLQTVLDRSVKIPRPIGQGPSYFIPAKEILQEGMEDAERQLFIEAFVSTGRVDNITMVMGLHPQYLECFWKTQYYLLQMDGPLPYHYRHYIALMAAARHQCSYLVSLHINEFLQVGGNPDWLSGLNFVPQKMRNLNEINKILAHRPWLITKEHIENLLTTGENSWSVAELIHAVVLLAHYHSLASFVLGCSIRPELDQEGGYTFRPPSPRSCDSDSTSSSGSEEALNGSASRDDLHELEVLMEKMKILQEGRPDEEASQEEKATRFEKEKRESLLVAPAGKTSRRLQSSKYIGTAFLLLQVLSLSPPPPLSRYDDYDYGEVNHLLERNLKVYIKTVACYPDKTTKRMYTNFWKHFRHSEKVHVNLLLLEARIQAALLYALRAITRYMT